MVAHPRKLANEVIAIPGDNVWLSTNSIRVNNINYDTPLQKYDSKRHRLIRFIDNGNYSNTKYFWLLGTNNQKYSWDSRYFGGVKGTDILGIYIPYWVTASKDECGISPDILRDYSEKSSKSSLSKLNIKNQKTLQTKRSKSFFLSSTPIEPPILQEQNFLTTHTQRKSVIVVRDRG